MISDVKDSWRLTAATLAVLATCTTTTACTPSSNSAVRTAPACSELLSAAVSYERSGRGDIDSTLQALSDGCSDEYEIAVDYISNSGDGPFSIDSCEELIGYGVREESVALLEQDGGCSYGGTEVAVGIDWPDGGVGWDDARDLAGTVQRVCGPLMSVRETADGTFVNIGRDYPDADRFTFIFWDIYMEGIEPDAIVCGTGEIYLYEGVVAQMELWDPTALEIWR